MHSKHIFYGWSLQNKHDTTALYMTNHLNYTEMLWDFSDQLGLLVGVAFIVRPSFCFALFVALPTENR